MAKNKIKFILVMFIVLTLSMNAFSATNFTEDSVNAPESDDSLNQLFNELLGTTESDSGDGQNNDDGGSTPDEGQSSGESDTNQDESQSSGGSDTNSSDSTGKSNSSSPSFDFNRSSSSSSFNFTNASNRTSGLNISDILSKFLDMFSDKDDEPTNETNITVESEVSNVPKIVTKTQNTVSKAPAPQKESQHKIIRLRDNITVHEGNTVILNSLNKLYDTNFGSGHLLVYIDGKLVFNELVSGDTSTPIFEITNSYVGQHQLVVEFTPNGNSNTNKYTENVYIE